MPRRSRPEQNLTHWLTRVLYLCNRDLSAKSIHDLRVSLRRSRSLAGAMMTVDPNGAWKKMDKRARALFKRLGKLRNLQVMEQWTRQLTTQREPIRLTLLKALDQQEQRQKIKALEALDDFDQKKWRRWLKTLPRRAKPILEDRPLCETLALARLQEAAQKHREALRKRDLTTYHQLRVSLKRFRYTVENFLPDLYPRWERDLKLFQDLLGEVNDLQNLWLLLDARAAELEPQELAAFRRKIALEQRKSLAFYHRRTKSARSPWMRWENTLQRQLRSRLRRTTKFAA